MGECYGEIPPTNIERASRKGKQFYSKPARAFKKGIILLIHRSINKHINLKAVVEIDKVRGKVFIN